MYNSSSAAADAQSWQVGGQGSWITHGLLLPAWALLLNATNQQTVCASLVSPCAHQLPHHTHIHPTLLRSCVFVFVFVCVCHVMWCVPRAAAGRRRRQDVGAVPEEEDPDLDLDDVM